MSTIPNGFILPEENRDFMGIRTHSRYVVNIYALLKQADLIFSLQQPLARRKLVGEDKIIKKLDIVKYTLDSIQTDYKFSQQDVEFMPLSLSWLWIKGYYGLFHLISLLISLEKSDGRYMLDRKYNEHGKVLSLINECLTSRGEFNIKQLNTTYSGKHLNKFKTDNHANIKNIDQFDNDLYQLTLKKVFKEETKLKLKGLRGSLRKKQAEKIDSKCYSIFDIFHYYRERFNYAGFHYLDSDDQPDNQLELSKFYQASYFIIITLVKSINDYLTSQTDGKLKLKLEEIKITE